MPKVSVLPEHIASQIAAGEVVERPSSVVKELVENAIDAGATQIEISIGADCRDIRVADNGCGMEPEDAVLAFHRHATSKLASAEDLWNIHTMGFRGEALPSIASVAKITCYTKTAEAAVGTKVEAADGRVAAAETGCAPGTVIEVTDLFYNVPARLKFLKKPATEFAHIHETVQSLAVSFPKIVFQLLNRGEVVLKTSGSGKLAQAMIEVGLLSGDEELCQITHADVSGGLAIYGYAARPTRFRGDRKGIICIVNNRPVRCPLTYKALDYAYSDLIPKGRHPFAAVTITIDPSQVDVNVHPTKKEIKYSNSNDVYLSIQRAIVSAIRQPAKDEDGDESEEEQPAREAGSRQSEAALKDTPAVSEAPSAPPVRQPASRLSAEQLRISDRPSYSPPFVRVSSAGGGTVVPMRSRISATLPEGWRVAGYVHNTYFLVETYEGMEIIEQHIAHERVLYEKLLAAQETPGRLSENSQRLVISAPLNLSPAQRSVVEENLEVFRAVGFDFEVQGKASVVCTQVPLELAQKDYTACVQQMIEDVSLTDKAEIQQAATKSAACQAAVKNGMPLSESDIVLLLSEWLKTPRNDTCPHGRPIRQAYSLERLYRLFHPH